MGVRLLLVLEHSVVRRRFRTLLQDHEGWEVVAEAGDGREATRLAEKYEPDVAIVDFAMPVSSGLQTTRWIVARSPATRVIVLCTHAADVYFEHARLAGAAGFVLTDAADQELPAAIDAVSKGRVFTSPALHGRHRLADR